MALRVGRRSGIGRVLVAFVIFMALLATGITLIVYSYESFAGRPKAAVILGASTDSCSRVSFHVQNQDSRILHGWSVIPVVTPTDSHIHASPDSYSIDVLGPSGNSTQHVFSLSFEGAPTGVYHLQLNLVNGSASIASSPSLSCKV